MKKDKIPSKVVVIAVFTLFAIAFVRVSSRNVSAALPAPAPARSFATSLPEPQQFPVMDKIADKIIQKYQGSTCEQLWQEKAQAKNKPKSTQEQEAISILRNDPQMRAAFINKVAPPIAGKMFDCGMIP